MYLFSSMSSPPSYYTDLFPKWGDITGSNNQAFNKGQDLLSHFVRGIRANTIAAIGTLAPGTSIVQYLFSPKIHHDLGGAPKSIVGNASNKLGEFSCVTVPIASLKLFACIAEEKKMMGLLPYLLALENKVLANTDWFQSTDEKYVAVLLPNFFILYFGQKPPTGDIMLDDVKMEFLMLGTGYKTWCNLAGQAINSSRKIATVLNNAATAPGHNHTAFVQKYFDKDWTGKMELTAEGPILLILWVSSEVFPIKTSGIKKDYLAQPPTFAGP
jgi:hypothetical protein